MKLLVFAHIPPPHHGQSYMVKLMLDHLGGDARARGHVASEIECYHVDSRYSDNLEDIGSFRFEKGLLVLRYCLEAIWCRFRYGVDTFYYVPAPGKRAALYRDWLVMILCRPFFRHFVHHWHAVGLGDWLQREGTWLERWITHRFLNGSALGLALGSPSMRDPLWFLSRRVELVPNGIPDPCPDFDTTVLPRRQERVAARRGSLAEVMEVRVLFLAHCTESKGLFDTLTAVSLANQRMRTTGGKFRFRLTVAGAFVNDAEKERFHARLAEPDLAGIAEYAGFVSGSAKAQLLAASDFLCFPTYYEAEGQPVNLIEAMAFGLAPVTTHWRGIPELLPPGYPGLVPIHQPEAVATALIGLLSEDHATSLRAHFLAQYTEDRHLECLRSALQTLPSAA